MDGSNRGLRPTNHAIHYSAQSSLSTNLKVHFSRLVVLAYYLCVFLPMAAMLVFKAFSAAYSHLDAMELLLNRGADPTIGTMGNKLPLHFAAEAGHLPLVEHLLQQPTVNLEKRDSQGQTALFTAIIKGHHAVVELLLQQPRVNPSAHPLIGFTPLQMAVFKGHSKVVRLLLDRPDVNPNLAATWHQQIPL